MSTRSSKQSLQDPKNKQDVLKAILNVKKYAKNLKRNADTFYERNLDEEIHEITSSPSFFQSSKGKSSIEASETLIKDEISYRETSSKVLRQKKDHSMASMPSSKREELSAFTKHKQNKNSKQPSEIGSSREGTYSMKNSVQSKRQLLSQSYKGENLWSKIMMPSEDSKSNKTDQQIIQIDEPISSKQLYVTFHPQIIKQLIAEIKRLKEQISLYKSAMLLIKNKYKIMEEKLSHKIQSDHLIDILKEQISNLQSNNSILNCVIEQQNHQIRDLGEKTKQSISQIFEHFRAQQLGIKKLRVQNYMLKKMVANKCLDIEIEIGSKKGEGVEQLQNQGWENNEFFCGSGEKYQSICLNEKQFCSKYSMKNQLFARKQ